MIAVCMVPTAMTSDTVGLWHSLQSHHGPLQSYHFSKVYIMYETEEFILS